MCIYTYTYTYTYTCVYIILCYSYRDSRLFGPSPWKILATTYEHLGENLVSGNLVMQTGCTYIVSI